MDVYWVKEVVAHGCVRGERGSSHGCVLGERGSSHGPDVCECECPPVQWRAFTHEDSEASNDYL